MVSVSYVVGKYVKVVQVKSGVGLNISPFIWIGNLKKLKNFKSI